MKCARILQIQGRHHFQAAGQADGRTSWTASCLIPAKPSLKTRRRGGGAPKTCRPSRPASGIENPRHRPHRQRADPAQRPWPLRQQLGAFFQRAPLQRCDFLNGSRRAWTKAAGRRGGLWRVPAVIADNSTAGRPAHATAVLPSPSCQTNWLGLIPHLWRHPRSPTACRCPQRRLSSPMTPEPAGK